MVILSYLIGLVALVMFIMVLIKQFQTAGPIHGIIGIVTCGIWTFIWGWMNSSKLGIRNLMLIWTLCIVLNIVLTIAFGGMAAMSGMTPTGVAP
jgi:hypothetical protein